jgi:uncharacterized protein (DUF952 family)
MIYHMVRADFWNYLSGEDPYESQSYGEEGFIHCSSTPEQLLNVANRMYKGDPDPFFIVCIDEDQLSCELRWEQTDEESFPHVYGLLNREAVVNVIPFPRDADGTFLMPDELVNAER